MRKCMLYRMVIQMGIYTFGKTPLNSHYPKINGIQWDHLNGKQWENLSSVCLRPSTKFKILYWIVW